MGVSIGGSLGPISVRKSIRMPKASKPHPNQGKSDAVGVMFAVIGTAIITAIYLIITYPVIVGLSTWGAIKYCKSDTFRQRKEAKRLANEAKEAARLGAQRQKEAAQRARQRENAARLKAKQEQEKPFTSMTDDEVLNYLRARPTAVIAKTRDNWTATHRKYQVPETARLVRLANQAYNECV